MASYVAFVGLFVLIQRAAGVVGRWRLAARPDLAAGGCLAAALFFAVYDSVQTRGQWLRQGYITAKGRYSRFAPTYRHDLAELIAHLRGPEYAERRAILTFDHLAHVLFRRLLREDRHLSGRVRDAAAGRRDRSSGHLRL